MNSENRAYLQLNCLQPNEQSHIGLGSQEGSTSTNSNSTEKARYQKLNSPTGAALALVGLTGNVRLSRPTVAERNELRA